MLLGDGFGSKKSEYKSKAVKMCKKHYLHQKYLPYNIMYKNIAKITPTNFQGSGGLGFLSIFYMWFQGVSTVISSFYLMRYFCTTNC